MAGPLRRVQVSLVAVATVLAMASLAQARPTIAVVATIDPADVNFRNRLAWELKDGNRPETPEQYIAAQFVDVFSALHMFRFIAVAAPGSSLTLRLRLSSDGNRPW